MNIKMNSQSGLSFIEMIVASLMVAVLAGLSVNTVEVFKSRAFMSQSQNYYNQIGTALAAGRVDYNMSNPDGTEEVRLYSDGTPVSEVNTSQNELLPGFRHDPKMSVVVVTYPQCLIGSVASPCIIDQIVIHHCQTETQLSVANYSDESTLEVLSTVPKSC
jgi:type II secretory pathway pseudopilin PulG